MATQSVASAASGRGREWKSFRSDFVGLPVGGAVYIAFAVHAAFPHRTPSIQELRDRFGMSKATAYRYRGAMKAARGEF